MCVCGGWWHRGSGLPLKSQVALCVFKNTDTEPPSLENSWTPWVLLLLEGCPYGPSDDNKK